MPDEVLLGRLVAEIALDNAELQNDAEEAKNTIKEVDSALNELEKPITVSLDTSGLEDGCKRSVDALEEIRYVLQHLGVDAEKSENVISRCFSDTTPVENYILKMDTISAKADEYREQLKELVRQEAELRRQHEEMNRNAGSGVSYVSTLSDKIGALNQKIAEQELKFRTTQNALDNYVKKAVESYDKQTAAAERAAQKQTEAAEQAVQRQEAAAERVIRMQAAAEQAALRQTKQDVAGLSRIATTGLYNIKGLAPEVSGYISNITYNVSALRSAMRSGASTGMIWGQIIVAAAGAVMSAVQNAFEDYYRKQDEAAERSKAKLEAMIENARQYSEELRQLEAGKEKAFASPYGEEAVLNAQLAVYNELRNKIGLTSEEKKRLGDVAGSLAKTLDITTEKLKDESGAYVSLTHDVEAYIKTVREQAQQKYYLDVIEASSVTIERLSEPIERAKKAMEDAKKEVERLKAEFKEKTGMEYTSGLLGVGGEIDAAAQKAEDLRLAWVHLTAESESAKASLEDAQGQFRKLADGADNAKDSVDELAYSFAESLKAAETRFNNTFSALQKAASLLNKVRDEVEKNGSISLSTLDSISSKYPKLNDLVSDYIAGVKTEADVISALTEVYERDVENYNSAVSDKKIIEKGFTQDMIDSNKALVNKLKDNYGIDLQNFATAAEAKAAIQKKYDEKMLEAREKYRALEDYYITVEYGEQVLKVKDPKAEGGSRRATNSEIRNYYDLQKKYLDAQAEAIKLDASDFEKEFDLAKEIAKIYADNSASADNILKLADSSGSGSSKSKQEKEAEDQRKKEIEALNKLGDAVVSALKNKYEQQKKLEEDRISESIENWKNWETQTVSAIQGQIDALDELKNAHDEESKRAEYEQKRQELELQLRFEKDSYNREQIQKQLAALDKAESERLYDLEIETRKKELRQKQDEVRSASSEKQNALKSEKDIVSQRYKELMTDSALNSLAQKTIAESSAKQIADLINAYAPGYDLLGKKIGEQVYSSVGSGNAIGLVNSVASGTGQPNTAQQLLQYVSDSAGRQSSLQRNYSTDRLQAELTAFLGQFTKPLTSVSDYKNMLASTANSAADRYYQSSSVSNSTNNSTSKITNVYMTINFSGDVSSPIKVKRELEKVGYEIAKQIT